MHAANTILNYLKGNKGKGIHFKTSNVLVLDAYTNEDYAGSTVDRMSTSEHCTILDINLVTWQSKKHNVVIRSSAEAEFRSMALGIFELVKNCSC